MVLRLTSWRYSAVTFGIVYLWHAIYNIRIAIFNIICNARLAVGFSDPGACMDEDGVMLSRAMVVEEAGLEFVQNTARPG